MVTIVEGNLLESPAQVLTNAVNCVGAMGAGIAGQFKSQFPEMYDDYRLRCAKHEVKIGQPYLWENESRQILNFPTKNEWKKPSQLSYVEEGLKYLSENYDQMGISSIAMPALGCGLGGLEWDDVLLLVKKYLDPIPTLDVFLYRPKVAGTKTGIGDKSKSNDAQSSDGIAAQTPLF